MAAESEKAVEEGSSGRAGAQARLTKSQRTILGLIGERGGVSEEGALLSKAEIAAAVKCSVKTVDRALRRLRDEGYVSSEPRHADTGAETGNVYFVGRR